MSAAVSSPGRTWPGHGALVEGLGAFPGDAPQHGGIGRVPEPRADRLRRAVGLEEIGPGLRVAAQGGLAADQLVEPRADRKALLRQADGRLEQPRPRQLAVLAMRLGQHGEHAGRAGGQAAHDGLAHRQRLAVGLEEHLRRGGGGRRLAAVEGLHLVAVPMHQEGAARDAAGLRLDEAQHGLYRDGRIDGRAAGPQHLDAGIHGQRVGGRDGKAPGGCGEAGRLGGAGRGRLGLVDHSGALRGGRPCQEQRSEQGRKPRCRRGRAKEGHR
jgi:hypothetical protein